jgi:transcriptional regulator with XRE-family HTH domain
MSVFGERFKQLREQRELSQIEIAKHLGIVNSAISQYETGKRIPDHDMLEKIANFFAVSVDFLLGRDPEPQIKQIRVFGAGTELDISDLSPEARKQIFDLAETFRKMEADKKR